MQQNADAAFVGAPMGLRGTIQYIKFDRPTLAPMAFTIFCLKYKDECKPRPQQIVFRGGRLKLTAQRLAQMQEVNQRVNSAIRSEPNLGRAARRKVAAASRERRLQRLCCDKTP